MKEEKPENAPSNIDSAYLARRDQRESEVRDIARRTIVFFNELKSQGVSSEDMFALTFPYINSELYNFFARMKEEDEEE